MGGWVLIEAARAVDRRVGGRSRFVPVGLAEGVSWALPPPRAAHLGQALALHVGLDPLEPVRVLLLPHALVHLGAQLLRLLQREPQVAVVGVVLGGVLQDLREPGAQRWLGAAGGPRFAVPRTGACRGGTWGGHGVLGRSWLAGALGGGAMGCPLLALAEGRGVAAPSRH